ncbi:heme peroxidase [Mycena leptocephala]|nr:heme peroxidase [Mycena leptocephala]
MLFLAFLTHIWTASAYIWPSAQLDALEAARFDQADHNAGRIAGFVQPCDVFFLGGLDSTGRSNVGDWLRTAYHDMATHDFTDGTGGWMRPFVSPTSKCGLRRRYPKYNWIAVYRDQPLHFHGRFTGTRPNHRHRKLVGLLPAEYTGLFNSVSSGGPEIPFRGGRVDAAEPNNPGVPQPEQNLKTHIAAFARQGFSQTDMISLVACGHTFGGVQHEYFPDIVPELNDPNSTESVAHFDSTFVNFDNTLWVVYLSILRTNLLRGSAKEYIWGTTKDPLVVGFNHTTNSDKRIFGSDGNTTMRSFATSLKHFHSTCAHVLARMFDTVPRAVHLTEVITPLPVKPHAIQLILDGDTLKLFGEVRFWNMTADRAREVLLLWEDHIGRTHRATLNFAGLSTAVAGRYTAAWYAFNMTAELSFQAVDPAAGVTRMRFLVDGQVEDQGGVGFAVQDAVVFSSSSCATSQDPYAGHLDIAVRRGERFARVYLEHEIVDDVQRIMVVKTEMNPPMHPQERMRRIRTPSGALT